MELLRFMTAGSVDDGKSTLIGRLLYDSNSVLKDQLDAIERSSSKLKDGFLNLALLTDGLKAEREQGITIDVAYKYFNTQKRKFIIADAPGHIQYTRNMITGASNVNLAIVLIDARHGIIEQTYRHSYIVSLLRIPHIVVCINKMDLVDFSESVFNQIKSHYTELAQKLDMREVTYIPISALNGDNVVNKSNNIPWYEGVSLLEHLENISLDKDETKSVNRFPVQYVIRPQSQDHHDFRGYAGQVAAGVFKKGDEVIVYPSKVKTKIQSIYTWNGELDEAHASQSVTLLLDDNTDISRGNLIAGLDDSIQISQTLNTTICWMDSEETLQEGKKYILQNTTNRIKCVIKKIHYKIDVHTYQQIESKDGLKLNDIANVEIKLASPLAYDIYKTNPKTGAFILIDEFSNHTSASGVIL